MNIETKENYPTPEQWQKWQEHKSNKEAWIEEQERQDDIQENSDDMETKLRDLNAPSEQEMLLMTDITDLERIVRKRGLQWIKETIGEAEQCHNCGLHYRTVDMVPKKIYEGTDFSEDSPINYPTALFCRKCYGKN